MRVGLAGSALAGLWLGTGCPGSVDCTTEARSSVSLAVVDADGDAIAGATAVYAVDGGTPTDCEPVGDGLVCGWEVSGDFEITASAVGYRDATDQVTVTTDECHVVTQVVEIVLDAIECTDEALPSVEVTVASAAGGALTGVAVTYAVDGGAPTACDEDGALWRCGSEEAGAMALEASADGHQSLQQTVQVGEDECHVITEHVNLVLDPA